MKISKQNLCPDSRTPNRTFSGRSHTHSKFRRSRPKQQAPFERNFEEVLEEYLEEYPLNLSREKLEVLNVSLD